MGTLVGSSQKGPEEVLVYVSETSTSRKKLWRPMLGAVEAAALEWYGQRQNKCE